MAKLGEKTFLYLALMYISTASYFVHITVLMGDSTWV